MASFFQWLLNTLQFVSMLALTVWLVLLLPLSLFKPARTTISVVTLALSFLWGITVWVTAPAVLLNHWGTIGFVLGVVLLGVGSLPLAALASIINGEWGTAGFLVALVLPVWGARAFAGWLATTVQPQADTG